MSSYKDKIYEEVERRSRIAKQGGFSVVGSSNMSELISPKTYDVSSVYENQV